jgi:hypothetical protein
MNLRMMRLLSVTGAKAATAIVLMVIGAAAAAQKPAASAAPLQWVADIPLGGNTTRLDYESLDESRHLLFIAHLGDSAVIVVDTQAQRVVARIPGISHVHGVLAVPELGAVYASATGNDEVVAIDEGTLKVVNRHAPRTPIGVVSRCIGVIAHLIPRSNLDAD